MFKNVQLYRIGGVDADDTSWIEDCLSFHELKPCGSTAMQSLGWVGPRTAGLLVHAVGQQWMIALSTEQRLLPAAVVKQGAADRAKEIEAAEGRRVGRKEMRELREALQRELMPRAFTRRRTTFAWIDPVKGWLAVDAATPARAEDLLEQLRKSIDGLQVRLVKVNQSPTAAMTAWVAAGEAPASFTLDQDLELRSVEKAAVRYVKHALDGDDVREHVAHGKVATRVALTWQDKISFVLTEDLQIKRLAFLDAFMDQADGRAENEEERFDADFTLMAGELARLFDDLVVAMGGEQKEVM